MHLILMYSLVNSAVSYFLFKFCFLEILSKLSLFSRWSINKRIGKWDKLHRDIQKLMFHRSIDSQTLQTWLQNLLFYHHLAAKHPMEGILLVLENESKTICLRFLKNSKFCKVHIFWEGPKILGNLHLTFVLCSASQK